MKYIIRTTESGKRIPAEAVREKARSIKEKLLSVGLQYVEYQAVLGSLDPLGNRIEEQVTIVEDAGGTQYA